jgi:serine/threonine protein kinase
MLNVLLIRSNTILSTLQTNHTTRMDLTATSLRHPLACKKFMMEFKERDLDSTPSGSFPPTPMRGVKLQPFELFSRYTAIRPIAKGTYGYVIAARDSVLVDSFNSLPESQRVPDEGIDEESFYDQNTLVAIKKVPQVFEQGIPRMWLCAAREAQMLLQFEHENVICAKDIFIPLGQEHLQTAETIRHRSATFEDLYIVMDYKELTLRDVLLKAMLTPDDDPNAPTATTTSTKEVLYPLPKDYRQFILYQLLRGVGYLHACRVMHRDLKPENILVDLNYRCSICDFGQAKDLTRRDDDEDDPATNDFLATLVDNCTQWYAAPETITLIQHHTGNSGVIEEEVLHSADVWSIGAIAAEMVIGRPIFGTPHRGGFTQLPAITSVRGPLTEEEVEALCRGRHESDRESYKKELTKRSHCAKGSPKQFKEFLREACPLTDEEVGDDELELIERLLAYDPRKRPTCQEAISHRFFVDSEYDPVIDPEKKARVVSTVEKDEIQNASDARAFFWKLFLKFHVEVEELASVLNKPKPQGSSAVARGRLILQAPAVEEH